MFKLKNLSKDFISKIIEQAGGKVSQNVLEDFLFLLENEIKKHYFSITSESNLLRIIQYQFDIVFFINECLKYPHQIEILITIANNSNYLSDILVRNPEYFFWIINPSVINQTIDEKYYSTLLNSSLSAFKSFNGKVNIIRNFKRKEILRIGLKDIYLKDELKLVTNYLSILAVTISRELFKLCYNEILFKYKIEKLKNKYVLFSLGKLGGNELNYSSDIDLIAFYDKNTLIGKRIYYDQILSEAILLFIETAGKKTGSGFLYRVDLRLRPDGRNAPLCGSYTQYLCYYEMRGEDWERQMLIKANFLCGSKALYDRFSDYVSKFIYPASFTISPTEQIRKLKTNIEKENRTEENIKLISGGIRDIEFSLQALQLLNGGKDRTIRNGNSLEAIERLKNKKFISEEEASTFTNAYNIYRKAEHYLQLMNDRQTHNIPVGGELAERLAHFLGFNNLISFKKQIDLYRNSVRKIYSSIVEADSFINKTNDYDEIKFSDRKRSLKNIEFLRTGKSLFDKKQFDMRATSSFEKIEPHLNIFLTNSIDSDLVLENFARIIRTANFPQIWFDEFSDNKFFSLFLQLCEHSQKSIDLFAEDKSLRDDFLSRNSLVPLDNVQLADISLKSFLFRASIQLVSKSITSAQFSKLLTEFIGQSFKKTIDDFSSDKDWRNDFFIAGMGSFGIAQLSFSSDVDLIFVIRDINKYTHIQKDFQRLLQTLKNNFPGLEIDCRLRPEGKSSLLVWDIKDYKKYFSSRARIWEYQAFTKCKLIYGSTNLFDEFIKHYIQIVKEIKPHQIKTEILEMRKNLKAIDNDTFNVKRSSGGLIDIDFIITYLFLLNPSLILEQRKKRFLGTFNNLEKSLNTKTDFNYLMHGYEFLKNIELTVQNTFNIKIAKLPTDEKKLLKLSKALEFENSKSFLLKLNTVTTRIRKQFQTIFN